MAGISIPFILMYALLLSSLLKSALSQQPNVTMLEGLPSRRSAGIISLPEGSPWCEGRPTNWLPGHHNHEPDVPNCLVRGKWRPAKRAVLDELDVLNARDTPFVIDRHDCGAIDANGDGRIDIYCTVGADRGTGVGWNELYLTRKDGSLFKIVRHGLQRFNTMRTRHTTILRGANGTEFVFITANHGRREDGRYVGSYVINTYSQILDVANTVLLITGLGPTNTKCFRKQENGTETQISGILLPFQALGKDIRILDAPSLLISTAMD